MYAQANPNRFVDLNGNESVRQAWGIDEPQGFWSAFGKNVAYGAWNAISFGTLGRQDTLVEQYEAGQISDTQYWGRTAINGGSAAAIAVATAATGGAAAGVATGLGASTTVAGIVAGATAGVVAQGTTDLIEVAGTQTKSLDDVSGKDYALAFVGGGIGGGIFGAAAANPSSVRFNVNPNVRGLGALDDTIVQRSAQAVQRTIARTAETSYKAGQRAVTVVESAPPPPRPVPRAGKSVTVEHEPGWNASAFDRKARALQDLAARGKLGKAPNPVARNPAVAAEYKNRLIRSAYKQYGKSDPARFRSMRTRIRSMHADHVQELQLLGADEITNLQLLDPDVNVGVGRQIWGQIKDLPDLTPISEIVIKGPK